MSFPFIVVQIPAETDSKTKIQVQVGDLESAGNNCREARKKVIEEKAVNKWCVSCKLTPWVTSFNRQENSGKSCKITSSAEGKEAVCPPPLSSHWLRAASREVNSLLCQACHALSQRSLPWLGKTGRDAETGSWKWQKHIEVIKL